MPAGDIMDISYTLPNELDLVRIRTATISGDEGPGGERQPNAGTRSIDCERPRERSKVEGREGGVFWRAKKACSLIDRCRYKVYCMWLQLEPSLGSSCSRYGFNSLRRFLLLVGPRFTAFYFSFRTLLACGATGPFQHADMTMSPIARVLSLHSCKTSYRCW